MSVSIGPGATTLTVMLRRAELAGERAGEADEAGLRRGVVGLAGRAEQADDRRHEDDPPAAGPQHPCAARLATRKAAVRLASMTDGEVVLAHPQQQPVVGDAGVGDQHLDRAERLLDGRERGIDLGRVR